MGTITSSIGLISGINTGQIIDELMSLESQPVTLLQNRITQANTQKSAYTALVTSLQSLQTAGQTLEKPQTFQAATATSSDQNVLTATAANGAAVGSYSLQVAQLVTTQQAVSAGFSDVSSTPVGAGTITIDMGGGELSSTTTLAQLNGGNGVGAGKFRITDASGKSDIIDTSSDVTVDDVIKQINNSLDISVQASLDGDKLVLTDASGGTAGQLTVQDLSGGTAAADLGIAGTATAGVLTGSDINYISTSTQLSLLNDGRGVQTGTGGNDLTIHLGDNTTFGVNLATARSVGDVISAINTASGGKLTASIAAGANGLTLTDNTAGGGALTVTDANGSHAAEDLGLTNAASGKVLTGKAVLAGIDTTLLSSLRGGQGLSLGTVSFTDRAGDPPVSIDFSNANTVQDVIDDINQQTGGKLQASLKSSGNGIQITDTTGGTGNLVIADTGGGQTAAQLGIAGTFNAATPSVQGANMHRQWVTASTPLSALNGGKGIAKGSINIVNSKGASVQVNLSGGAIDTVADVISQINNAGLAGVTASINSTGNGIQITDTSGGNGKMQITDVDNTTAADLNIKGTATANTIDGAYEKTINVTANDTLTTVQQAINNLGWGVNAQIINDGSGTTPFRLSLTAQNSGLAGRTVIDSGTTNLGIYNLVQAQNAAVFLGSAGAAKPLLITSGSNQITGIIQGVTISLEGTSSSPVQLNVATDPSNIVTQLNSFVSTFNQLVSGLNTLTSFDTTTNTPGILLGDSTTQQIQQNMYDMLNTVVNTGSQYKTLADIGLTVGDGATLTFDQDTFNAAFAANPGAVEQLFSQTQNVLNADGSTTVKKLGVGYAIDNAMTNLVDPVSGTITLESNSLTQEVSDFQDQITSLDAILANKKAVLQEQFANMEEVLSNLQSQQSALNSFTGITPTTSSSSSSSSTSKTG
jgi:flagellar hook-associated protein 2